MAGLLEIEQQILETVREDPMHARLIRRVVAKQYDETCLRHTTFYAYLDAAVEKGYVTTTTAENTSVYTVTDRGERALDQRTTAPAA